MEAMPHGGSLKISTSAKGGHIFRRGMETFTMDSTEIRISDTGCGIAREDLDRIFQPFFTRKAKGTGLGLALVRKVIDMHKGEVEATSVEGQGTEFVIRLPHDQPGAVKGSTQENTAARTQS
jgi:signal transduction histidine kinase